jgi:hypothetical protein
MSPNDENRPKVLRLGVIEHAHSAWASVEEIADVFTPKSTNRADFLEEAASGAFDDCVAAYRTFDSFEVTGKIDGELLDALPRSLRFICHNGAGYDQVDVQACTAHNIRVSNTPTAVDDATADIGIFLLLGALRNLAVGMAAIRAGEWRGSTLPALGHDPQGKVLGILGMGGIGRNMAAKARAFGMKIRYYNRTRLEPDIEAELGAEYVGFDELLGESDVLSLNLPLNVGTPPSSPPLTLCHSPRLETADTLIGEHPTHHIPRRVCQDEKGHRDRQHGTRRRDRRGRACGGSRLGPSQLGRPRRLRARALRPPWPALEPPCPPRPAHGHLDSGNRDQDGGMGH